ncbi:tumor protein D52 isoform X1 [Pleurodeles waltl]|uniref:tumor protein D52 isoform X1 n=1 Tax=Pleurodeles waltl TaxID=8319 RepID=UPI0037094B94
MTDSGFSQAEDHDFTGYCPLAGRRHDGAELGAGSRQVHHRGRGRPGERRNCHCTLESEKQADMEADCGAEQDGPDWKDGHGDITQGLQGSPITGNVPVGEDALKQNTPETLSEEEQEELRKELEKVEDEINTLSQVLAAKEKHLAEIKRKLGVTALTELKQNISKGLQDVASTTVYKKTTETLSQAGQKASAAFSSVGSAITKKLEDVKNSPTFKSFEETVETLKTKVGGTKPAGGDFGEVLNSAANASANEPLIEHSPETQ